MPILLLKIFTINLLMLIELYLKDVTAMLCLNILLALKMIILSFVGLGGVCVFCEWVGG